MNTSDITSLFSEIINTLSPAQQQEVAQKFYNMLLLDKHINISERTALPVINKFDEITTNSKEIIKWANENPTDDHIYFIDASPKIKYDFTGQCVAGSSALHYVYQMLFPTKQIKWKSTDTDIFILNCEQNHRSPIGITDIVYAKEKSVEELLINFDLPVCRVAYNFGYKIWISAQCIAALFTNEQNVPEYLKTRITFDTILQQNREPFDSINREQKITSFLYKRFTERVEKYQNRGFGINWVKTGEVIPWIKNRFFYAEDQPTKTNPSS